MQGSNIWWSIEHGGEEIWSFDPSSWGAAKSVTVHCQGHSLSLSVKTMTKKCGNFFGEICILVKFSPKREHLLGSISDNIKKEDSEKLKTTFGNKIDRLQIMYEKSHW